MNNIRNEIQAIFIEVFGNDQLVLSDDLAANDIEGWDSLAHLNLVIALEVRMGIKFTTAEISDLKDDDQTVGNLIEMIIQKRN